MSQRDKENGASEPRQRMTPMELRKLQQERAAAAAAAAAANPSLPRSASMDGLADRPGSAAGGDGRELRRGASALAQIFGPKIEEKQPATQLSRMRLSTSLLDLHAATRLSGASPTSDLAATSSQEAERKRKARFAPYDVPKSEPTPAAIPDNGDERGSIATFHGVSTLRYLRPTTSARDLMDATGGDGEGASGDDASMDAHDVFGQPIIKRADREDVEREGLDEIPIDLSIKTGIRIVSKASRDYVRRCGAAPDEPSVAPGANSRAFHALLHRWQHPAAAYPEAVIGSRDPANVAWMNARYQEWEEAFESLFQMLRNSLCDYFYVQTAHFNVMFAGPAVAGPQGWVAIISGSTSTLRLKLDRASVAYTRPFQKHRSGPQATAEELAELEALHGTVETRVIDPSVGHEDPRDSVLRLVGRPALLALVNYLKDVRADNPSPPLLTAPAPFAHACLVPLAKRVVSALQSSARGVGAGAVAPGGEINDDGLERVSTLDIAGPLPGPLCSDIFRLLAHTQEHGFAATLSTMRGSEQFNALPEDAAGGAARGEKEIAREGGGSGTQGDEEGAVRLRRTAIVHVWYEMGKYGFRSTPSGRP